MSVRKTASELQGDLWPLHAAAAKTRRERDSGSGPHCPQILQRNVHVVMSMLPSAAARRLWRRTAILLRSVRLAVNSGEKNLHCASAVRPSLVRRRLRSISPRIRSER